MAALAVLVWHYQHFAFVADTPIGLIQDRLPLYRLLHIFYDYGPYAVHVFWCISGFIFFWKYRDAIADRSIDGWKFFVLRFSRLYPLHIATLLVVAALQPLYFNLNGYFFVYQNNDLTHFLLQLLMASNATVQSALSFNGPIWSISVEVLVYFFFFMMLRFAARSGLLNLVVIVVCLMYPGIGRTASPSSMPAAWRRWRGSGNVLGHSATGRECGLACHHRGSVAGVDVHVRIRSDCSTFVAARPTRRCCCFASSRESSLPAPLRGSSRPPAT